MAITYTPTFQHTEWVDNVDRVMAGGDNGFNIRFNGIETEFQALSQVVQNIDTALGSLGQQVSAPVTIGILPVLMPYTPLKASKTWSRFYWSYIDPNTENSYGTFAEKDPPQDEAWGVIPINLPSGVSLQSIMVFGDAKTTGSSTYTMTTTLVQELRVSPYTRSELVTVPAFPTIPTLIAGSPIFRDSENLYYLLAKVENATNTRVRLRGFQITYLP